MSKPPNSKIREIQRVLKEVYLSSLIIQLLHIHSVEGSIAEYPAVVV
jgi:hypothetical protein